MKIELTKEQAAKIQSVLYRTFLHTTTAESQNEIPLAKEMREKLHADANEADQIFFLSTLRKLVD